VKAFTGQGQRLDGKASSGKIKPVASKEVIATDSTPAVVNGEDHGRVGIPDYDFKIGTLHFMPGVKLNYSGHGGDKDEGDNFSPFGGSGHKLRPA
jgi:hypothetical protein